MRNRGPAEVLASTIVLLVISFVSGKDWPQWRGSNRDATATGFNAPKTWPKQLTQKWKVTVGNGDASPALVGDKLYVFTREDPNEVIRCLDAASGKQVWQDKYEAAAATQPAGGPHAGPRSSPTVADGKVVTLGVRGTLSCNDAATGKNLWRREDFHAWPRFFTSSSPIVVDGLCIAQLGGTNNGALVAYDLNSGEEKWRWAGGCPGYASPVLLTVDGTKLVVAETDSKIAAVAVTDGKPVWETAFPAQRMNYNASTPIVDGQTLIYGGGGRGEKAVKFEKQGDHVTAKEVWANPDESVQFNSPVLMNGVVYGLTQDNKFFALDARTGHADWTASASGQAAAAAGGEASGGRGGRGGRGRGGYGSIVAAGSVLIALTPSAELIVIEPSNKNYTELARIKVAGSATYAYPIVSESRIYIKDGNSLALWTVE